MNHRDTEAQRRGRKRERREGGRSLPLSLLSFASEVQLF
jgi:hypothetical protein